MEQMPFAYDLRRYEVNKEDVFKKVKRATVAMAMLKEDKFEEGQLEPPYTIIGSGFCIHPRGVVVTCEHVVSAFINKDINALIAEIPEADKKKELQPLRNVSSIQPYVLFFITDWSTQKLLVIPTRVEMSMAQLDYDLGLVRVAIHNSATNGYPTLEIEDFSKIYEGMELSTCGFPLGNFMQEQIGTVTSSFTRGSLSSIIPSPGAAVEHIKGFQLDLTATYGNSGGPVFSVESGKVFGVLQGGIVSEKGVLVPGISKAEPVYPLINDRTMKDILEMTDEEIRKRTGL